MACRNKPVKGTNVENTNHLCSSHFGVASCILIFHHQAKLNSNTWLGSIQESDKINQIVCGAREELERKQSPRRPTSRLRKNHKPLWSGLGGAFEIVKSWRDCGPGSQQSVSNRAVPCKPLYRNCTKLTGLGFP